MFELNLKLNLSEPTHTHTQPFNGLWSGTTRVGRYQKKHSPTHTHPDHQTSFINFLHLLRSIASSLFSLYLCKPGHLECLRGEMMAKEQCLKRQWHYTESVSMYPWCVSGIRSFQLLLSACEVLYVQCSFSLTPV